MTIFRFRQLIAILTLTAVTACADSSSDPYLQAENAELRESVRRLEKEVDELKRTNDLKDSAIAQAGEQARQKNRAPNYDAIIKRGDDELKEIRRRQQEDIDKLNEIGAK